MVSPFGCPLKGEDGGARRVVLGDVWRAEEFEEEESGLAGGQREVIKLEGVRSCGGAGREEFEGGRETGTSSGGGVSQEVAQSAAATWVVGPPFTQPPLQ